MRNYRVTMIGQVTGAPYTYSVSILDDVKSVGLAAKECALALHREEMTRDMFLEDVYPQGIRVRRAPRCWSLRVRRWRVVRCHQDDAHEHVTKWHFSPKGDVWKTNHGN